VRVRASGCAVRHYCAERLRLLLLIRRNEHENSLITRVPTHNAAPQHSTQLIRFGLENVREYTCAEGLDFWCGVDIGEPFD